MAADDWFRNATWNAEIEAAFFGRLRRARDKGHYLRIQASTLARREPEIALRLLDEYFSLGDHFDMAQAHVDRATARLALRQIELAMHAYEAALAVEAERPNLKTQAFLELPFLIACEAIKQRYEQAFALLEEHRLDLMFPVDHFRWHAALALMYRDLDRLAEACQHAHLALDAAERSQSGFRYHPSVGLVGGNYDDILTQLRAAVA